ncbi:MAG: ATPase [Erysipelotrichaceae bacterium]|nr:ATPase [Erysipelotrichaceae bacterium]MDY5252756.1 BadF/BadG/BcrA/BcrD ATPase family protein [Erysipelotrichaceae bacterium]
MSKKYVIGIDGGGTKTAFLLANMQGEVLSKVVKENSHYLTIGFEKLSQVIDMGIKECMQQVKCTSDDIVYCAVCICGYGDVKQHDIQLEKAIQSALGNIAYGVYSDTYNAHRGSLVGFPGIHVIAGTGSIAFGINAKGDVLRCGGWNHLFGGDEGSAYWLACKMLLEFTRQSDGRSPKSYLYSYLKDKYALDDDGQIIDLTVLKYGFDRTKIADMAKDLFVIAKNGDMVAARIYEEAAKELALLITTIGQKLNMNKPILVSYSGGVFNSGKYILDPLGDILADVGYRLVKPRFDPSLGSLIVAYKAINSDIDKEMLSNFDRYQENKENNG